MRLLFTVSLLIPNPQPLLSSSILLSSSTPKPLLFPPPPNLSSSLHPPPDSSSVYRMQSVRGGLLPNPRHISLLLRLAPNGPQVTVNSLFVQMGQFIDHDFSITTTTKGKLIDYYYYYYYYYYYCCHFYFITYSAILSSIITENPFFFRFYSVSH